ncbi:tail fiber assembly protein [Enterobacter genomosp. S]|uniref:Phage tail protein n=1 Tax=Enterobacter genomosp. S TaxID=2364151 RepID=A0ABR5YT64_9ENTR|nr:tail fiber assembly protein [Enterobacter genomosp. S]KZR35340.1 phage tail protein [Enterobacter genomosp. S]
MTVYFSASENGFYDDAYRADYIAAGTWPDDAAAISDQWYQHLLNGQALGRVVTVNEYGQPVLADPPAPTREQLIAEADARKAALITAASETISILNDAVDLGKATKEEEARLLAWREYRIRLMRVDTSLAPDIEWPAAPD